MTPARALIAVPEATAGNATAVLRRWGLLYLALPALLFLPTFVRPLWGVPVLAALLVALALVLRERMQEANRTHYLMAALAALALLAVAGFPHGPFAWDWIKHWALLNTLSDNPWPVITELQGRPNYTHLG